MKVTSVKIIKTGQGKNGPWTLIGASFDGKEGEYTGFYYDKPINVGDDVNVEFFQEEYNGSMQNKFKLLGKAAAQSQITEMAIKTEIARWSQEIIRKLDLIMQEMKIRDFKQEVEEVRNTDPGEPPF